METYPRPNVSPARYRQLENCEMQLALQLPTDLGEACIVLDLLMNRYRRYIADERLGGRAGDANKPALVAVEEGNLIRLQRSE